MLFNELRLKDAMRSMQKTLIAFVLAAIFTGCIGLNEFLIMLTWPEAYTRSSQTQAMLN